MIRGRSGRRSGDRAQTTIDFAVGASVFLLVVAFVLSFAPGMLDPFAGNRDGPTIADRTASSLATDLLGETGDPYELNETCTTNFFAGTSAPAGCSYGSDDLHEAVGLSPTVPLNLTLRKNVTGSPGLEVVCRDGLDRLVPDCATGSFERVARGESIPGGVSVTTAQRVVHVDGTAYRLYVRTW